jgi:hypothetical protein
MTDRLDIADLRREMIGDYVKSRELRFLRYENGDYSVPFRVGHRSVEYRLSTDPTGAMLSFTATASTTFNLDQLPLLLLVTNEFVQEHRWPRLSVEIINEEEVGIVADGHLLMADSLEEFEVARFLDSGIGATQQFWHDFVLPDLDAMEAEIITLLRENEDGAA